MWRWILFTLFTSVAVASPNISLLCNQENYLDYYFEACLADAFCANNFNLHAHQQTFFHYLVETELVRPMHLEWMDICEQYGSVVFMAILRTHEFCKPNHVMDIDKGCICRNDKQCKEKPVSSFRISELGKIIFTIILSVLVIYVGFALLKDVRKALHPAATPIAVNNPKAKIAEIRTQKDLTNVVLDQNILVDW